MQSDDLVWVSSSPVVDAFTCSVSRSVIHKDKLDILFESDRLPYDRTYKLINIRKNVIAGAHDAIRRKSRMFTFQANLQFSAVQFDRCANFSNGGVHLNAGRNPNRGLRKSKHVYDRFSRVTELLAPNSILKFKRRLVREPLI